MTLEKIIELLANQLEIDRALISPDTDIIEDLGADSLDIVELITAIEDEYNLVVTDERATEIHTVRDLASYIERFM